MKSSENTYVVCLEGATEKHPSHAAWKSVGGYHQAAEEFIEWYETESYQYEDEWVVRLRDIKHDTPRKFTVYTGSIRTFHASEN